MPMGTVNIRPKGRLPVRKRSGAYARQAWLCPAFALTYRNTGTSEMISNTAIDRLKVLRARAVESRRAIAAPNPAQITTDVPHAKASTAAITAPCTTMFPPAVVYAARAPRVVTQPFGFSQVINAASKKLIGRARAGLALA